MMVETNDIYLKLQEIEKKLDQAIGILTALYNLNNEAPRPNFKNEVKEPEPIKEVESQGMEQINDIIAQANAKRGRPKNSK